jgi:RNA recognition motif-containing protein
MTMYGRGGGRGGGIGGYGGRGGRGGRGMGGRISRLNGASPYGASRAPNLPLHKFAGRRVYVNNLSWNTTWHGLKDHFKHVGTVIRADVMEDMESGRSKGCGLVEFASKEDAARAISICNDTELDSRQIQVREDRETSGLDEPEVTERRLYVQNLSWNVNWKMLKEHFGACGTVLRADVLEDRATGRSKGCGVVEMSSPEEAKKATAMLNESELGGRPIYIREDRDVPGNDKTYASRVLERLSAAAAAADNNNNSSSGGERKGPRGAGGGVIGDQLLHGGASADLGDGSKVYVGNLSYDVTWRELKDHMKTAGPVAHADVAAGEDGKSKGYGLVEYQNNLGAQQAIAILNNTELQGRLIFVREDREA